MKPQGFGQMGGGNLEDLGWNDMGFEPPKAAEAARDADHDAFGEDVVEHLRVHPTGLTPVGSPVHDQQAEIVERFNGADETEADEVVESVASDQTDEGEIEVTAEIHEPEAEAAPAPTPMLAKPVRAKPVVAIPAVATAPLPHRAPRARSAPGTKGRAAFTLRLDPNRHLKLRLACAVDGRSAQQLVTDALDQLLERMPDLNGLAEKAKSRG
jgi:hypothetical protein